MAQKNHKMNIKTKYLEMIPILNDLQHRRSALGK